MITQLSDTDRQKEAAMLGLTIEQLTEIERRAKDANPENWRTFEQVFVSPTEGSN